MSTRWKNTLLGVVMLVGIAGTAGAQQLTEASGSYVITPKQTSISFRVASIGAKPIRGSFGDFGGIIDIDAKTIGRSRVSFVLKSASVDGGEPRVTRFLKSNAIFFVEKWPVITFASRAVRRTGEHTARVEGVVTARGKSIPAVFRAELQSLQGRMARFKVTGRVPRSPFGMDAGLPVYSNYVEFDINIAASRR